MFINILVVILILGVLIFVHELGHFVFAKLSNAYVQEFSIGIGPKLLKLKFWNSPFFIRAFPLGGYVSLTGEVEDEGPGSFVRLKWYKQLLVIFGGIIFNIVFAYVLMFVFLAQKPVLEFPMDIFESSYAKIIEKEHVLFLVDVSPDSDLYGQLEWNVKVDQNIQVNQNVQKDGQENNSQNIHEQKYVQEQTEQQEQQAKEQQAKGQQEQTQQINLDQKQNNTNNTTNSYQEIDLQNVYIIKKLNNKPIDTFLDLKDMLSKFNQGDTVLITLCKIYQPELDQSIDECKNISTYKVHLLQDSKLGVTVSEVVSVKLSYQDYNLFARPIFFFIDITKASYKLLKQIFQNAYMSKDLSMVEYSVGGPVSIVPIVDQILQSKSEIVLQLLFLVGLFSFNLALINAIPFPGLDGWHAVLSILRIFIKNKKFYKALKILTIIGLIILFSLAIIVTFKDIKLVFTMYGK